MAMGLLSGCFRDDIVAASLKPLQRANVRAVRERFRDDIVAASLKHVDNQTDS